MEILKRRKNEPMYKLLCVRKSRRFTQKDLAKRCELNTASIVAYENGYWLPKLSTLQKLATALNCTVADII